MHPSLVMSALRSRSASHLTSTRTIELALVVAGAGYNWLANRLLPRWAYVPSGLLASGAAVALCRRNGIDARSLGLERARIGDGVRVGVVTSATVAAGIVGVARLSLARQAFDDARVLRPSGWTLGYEVGVRIPFGTAAAEELLFRAALLGASQQHRSWAAAAVLNSVLFGLWHVLPTLSTAADNTALRGVTSRHGKAVLAASGVGSTAIAGVALCAARRRSGSVVAPMLLHTTVNTVAFAAARVVARGAGQPSPATTRPDSYASTTA